MNIFVNILIKLVKGYRFLISPLLGDSCRYFPTCSDYTIEALREYGLIKGIFLSFRRILSCQPWGKGGIDPVKKPLKVKKNGI
ncbi:membrane protein insertion efficiency factor YidD [Pelagibacterales bacterium SAG-MED47]|nr:membrane protein insertion efficiency factor YidD [Pelagibacterales bacterium SAG-MED47]